MGGHVYSTPALFIKVFNKVHILGSSQETQFLRIALTQ